VDLSSVQAQNEELKATLRNYEEEIKRLNELLRKLRRACFGKKSERIENLPTEQLVFNELEASVKEDPKEDLPKKVITYTRGTGRKNKEPYFRGTRA